MRLSNVEKNWTLNNWYRNILILGFVLLISLRINQSLKLDFSRIRINKAWISLQPENSSYSNEIEDGIPDQWIYHAWGSSRQIYRLDDKEAFDGKYALTIERKNNEGGAAIAQDIYIQPDETRLKINLFAKGTGGVIQLKILLNGGKTWKDVVWEGIEPSGDWLEYKILVDVPPDTSKARLMLRASDFSYFDNVSIQAEKSGKFGANLIMNPGFEIDGDPLDDPVVWWENIVGDKVISLDNAMAPEQISYLNVADMINGRYAEIKCRASRLGDNCVQEPSMTSWLLAKGDEFERLGGKAAREHLFMLAIELAPNCPQPYAALAELYKSKYGYWKAAELYNHASELADGTILAGRYSFEEGMIHVRNTGVTEFAISALEKAERISGWESSAWYIGAASYNLGGALEKSGDLEAAKLAYQRVIDCKECSYYHSSATEKLGNLVINLEE